jgi:hypothetical protein
MCCVLGFMFYAGHTEQVARYVLSRQSRYQLVGGEYLHAGEGAPALAEVFDGGSDVVYGSVNAEEAVVRLTEGLDLYGRVPICSKMEHVLFLSSSPLL